MRPEDAASVSCFSCKSRKAREEKSRRDAEEAAAKAAAPTTFELKIEVPKSKPIDRTLFQGLDNNVIVRTEIPPDQTTEIITITRVGAPQPSPTVLEKSEAG